MQLPTDNEKKAVWEAYRAGNPTRVPLRWNTNARIILLDPALNPDGVSFETYCHDPLTLLTIQARYQEYLATTLSRTCDAPSALPDHWTFHVDHQNAYDGAYLGAPVDFAPGQCPSNVPCLGIDDVDEFLARDFSHPLDNPWLQARLAFHAELVEAAKDFRYLGRGGEVSPLNLGFDGPVTIAAVLMGSAFFEMLALDPDKSVRFMQFIMAAALARNRALHQRHGTSAKGDHGWLADDSIQLISTGMYERLILPLHAFWYTETSTTTPADLKRSIHLCGDDSRHFKVIHERLGVATFDTGFPIDHGAIRRELGPEVEISGGPRVSLLQDGTPEACAAAARQILESGVMAGGRFILQEGNNLPPRCPLENLAAVYETCREFGRY